MAASYQSAVRRVQEGYFLSSYIKTLFPSRLQSKALCMQMDQMRCNQWLGFGSLEAEFFISFYFPFKFAVHVRYAILFEAGCSAFDIFL